MCVNFEIASILFELCIVPEPATTSGTGLLLDRYTGGGHSADPCCSGSDMSGYCRRIATTELLDCQLGKVLAIGYSSSFPPLFSHLCRPTTNGSPV